MNGVKTLFTHDPIMELLALIFITFVPVGIFIMYDNKKRAK